MTNHITTKLTHQSQDQRHKYHHLTTTLHLTLKMTTAQVVETSVTNTTFTRTITPNKKLLVHNKIIFLFKVCAEVEGGVFTLCLKWAGVFMFCLKRDTKGGYLLSTDRRTVVLVEPRLFTARQEYSPVSFSCTFSTVCW